MKCLGLFIELTAISVGKSLEMQWLRFN